MSANDETLLVYDGDCPFCSHYVSYMRLRDSVGPVTLLDARQGGPAVDDILHQGYDLDEGMVLRLHGRYYHGADCVHTLAMLSSESGVFNRINARIFRHPMLARRLYPIMRAGRNAVLVMLGRRRLKDSATLQP